MQKSFDQKIRDGLRNKISIPEISEVLYQELLDLKDIEKIKQSKIFFKFLWHTKDASLFTHYFFKAWDDGFLVLPWGHWLELILPALPKPLPENFLIPLHKALEITNGSGESKKSPHWDLYEPKNKERRDLSFHQVFEKMEKSKLEIIRQLRLAQSQGMKESEKKLILQLRKISPTDPLISEYDKKQTEQKAAHLIKKRAAKAKNLFQLQKYNTLEPEVVQAGELMAQSLTAVAEEHPEMIQDLAVALLMMGLPNPAALLLEKLQPTQSVLWLYHECLWQQKRFVEIISLLNTIESSLAHASETFAATAYARAQAYWNLGDFSRAISIMESLLETYPEYRSAEVILSSWRNP